MYSSRECQGFEGLFEAITILNDQEAVALVGRHSALKVSWEGVFFHIARSLNSTDCPWVSKNQL